MFSIILLGIVSFFASFGVLEFCKLIINCNNKTKGKIISVIPLHNDGKYAEGIVRNAFSSTICDTVVAVDYDSVDDTIEILNGLSKQYSNLYVFTIDEFVNYMKDYYNDK